MEKDHTSGYKWILLVLVSATYFLAQGSRQIFNAVLPQIKADFAGAALVMSCPAACETDYTGLRRNV